MRKKLTMVNRILALFLIVAMVLGNTSIGSMEASAEGTGKYETWAKAAADASVVKTSDEGYKESQSYDVVWVDSDSDAYTIYTAIGLAWVADQVSTGDTFSDDPSPLRMILTLQQQV